MLSMGLKTIHFFNKKTAIRWNEPDTPGTFQTDSCLSIYNIVNERALSSLLPDSVCCEPFTASM